MPRSSRTEKLPTDREIIEDTPEYQRQKDQKTGAVFHYRKDYLYFGITNNAGPAVDTRMDHYSLALMYVKE